MIMKLVSGILAIALFAIFSGAIIFKMKEVSLTIVILIGFVMMAADLYQSIRRKDD